MFEGIRTSVRVIFVASVLGAFTCGSLRAQEFPGLLIPPIPAPATLPATTPPALPPVSSNELPASAPAPATPPSTAPAVVQVTEQVTPADLDDLKKRTEASADLSDEQKKTVLDLIEQARAELAHSAEFTATLKDRQQKADEIETSRQKAQASLDAALREKPQTFSGFESLPKLEQTLASKQQDLVNAQNELAQTEKRLNDRSARQKAIKDRLAAIPGELESITSDLGKLTAGTESSLLVDARRFRLLAFRKRLESESPSLQAEAAFLSAQEAANLIQLARQEWTAKVARVKDEVSALQQEVLRQKSRNAEGRKRIAEEDGELASLPQLKRIYEENVKLVEQEIEFREKEKKLKDEIASAGALIDWVNEKHKDLEYRKGKIGTSKSFGIRLRNERKLLPDTRKYREQMTARIPISQDAQLKLIDVSSQVSLLSHLDNRVNSTVREILPNADEAELSDESRYEHAHLAADVLAAYEQQQKYLTELQSASEAYVSALDTLDAQQDTLITATQSFQKFIDENILWVPTNSLLHLKDIFQDSKSLHELFNMTAWRELGARFLRDIKENSPWYFACTLTWLILLFSQARQREMIRKLGQKASSRLNTAMRPTWLAIFWTTVKSLVVPFPLLILGWRGMQFEGAVKELSSYVYVLTVWLLWLELVRNTCRDRGLGVAHFQWPERANRVVLVQFSSFIVLATPLIFAVAILKSRTPDEDALPLDRVFSVAYYLLLAHTLHRLTSRKTGILREWIELHPGGWMDRLAGLWNLIAVSLPLFLAGLTIAGYTYASSRLAVRLARTLMVVFAGLFAKAVLVRWLTLRQRRLAIEHAREVRAALAESKGQDDATSTVKLDAQEARTNLVEVSMQSKRLINTSIVLLSLACVWYIWIDVLPALKRLDAFTIPYLQLSLAKVLIAGLMAILFTTAARNIPGLLEMLLLERLPLDRSVRYAIGALTRYVIVFMGIMTIGPAIGFEWNDVQWLVAALTFGLGFGLQEIFANFVSGLIILFEQPVRVGDVVTIDSVTGTVSRIRIRSTTIVDWDRREYIVPNKEFITGRLLNWTLSDTTNRLVLNVRVSYNADPVLVRELLFKIVRTQPLIMTEPGPTVSFESFGDSALNFVIRAYLPNMDQRTETLHQLYVRIHKEFAIAGIEIPLPQQDLHLRTTVPIPVQEAPAAPSRTASPASSSAPDSAEEPKLETV